MRALVGVLIAAFVAVGGPTARGAITISEFSIGISAGVAPGSIAAGGDGNLWSPS
jgi:hypothetical protein